jgi:hypothetical protein
MPPRAFAIRKLRDKNSPFILSVTEWRNLSNYMKKCISMPIDVEAIEKYICTTNDGIYKKSWDRLVDEDNAFCTMITIAWVTTLTVKSTSIFWGDGERAEIISLAHNIVTDIDLMCIKHHDDFIQVLLEAQNGNLSPNTKSKFIYMCEDLYKLTLRYHQQAQIMMGYLSKFYTEIEGCIDGYERCAGMISRIGIRNHLEFSVVSATYNSLATSVGSVIPSKTHITPLIRKIHLIFSAISYDLQEVAKDMSEDLNNLPAIIAALELELAFENLSSIRNEAEDFYKNAEDFS